MVSNSPDLSTIDLNCSCVRLRADLVFTPMCHRGRISYQIEVTSTATFYQVGYAEYVFISLLDGTATFAEALTVTAQRLGPQALTQAQATRVYSWLVENQLAHFTSAGSALGAEQGTPARSGASERLNPFWARIPLFRPDALLAVLLPFVGWIFSLPAVLSSLVLTGVAVVTASSHWDRFLRASDEVFSRANWLWLLAAWVILKIVHEFSHAIACRRYGGEVREMGIVFVLFAPLAWVDVTSSWRFPSKWQRIHVAAAGIYVELIIAAIATIAWSRVESPLLAHLLYNLVFMASVSTIAFNLNPLMRFDGYYILADLLEIPNLYSESARRTGQMASWLFYGTHSDIGCARSPQLWLLGIYGISAILWRTAVCFSLVLIASVLWEGSGILLAAFGVICWFGMPLWRAGREFRRQWCESPPAAWRAVVVSTFLIGAVVSGFTWIPSPVGVTAPGIVDYENLTVVRSAIAGVIDRVHVTDGEFVSAGDVLLTLQNEEISNAYHDLLLAIEQCRIRQRIALDRQEPGTAQVERRNREALEHRLASAKHEFLSLSVVAPSAGKIVARTIQQLPGRYVTRGQELLAIGAEAAKELVLSVADSDVDQVLPRIDSDVRIRIGIREMAHGRFARVEPRASTHLTHPAMAATEGGPLTVRQPDTGRDHGESSIQLTEPRYRAVVRLPAAVSQSLYCGEIGYVAFGPQRESIGTCLSNRLEQWIRGKLRSATRPSDASVR